MSQFANELPRLTLFENRESLEPLLEGLRRLLAQNPGAVRLVASALVAEGRRFAGTAEGQAWQARLAGSTLARQGRLIWQAFELDTLIDDAPGRVPSDWLRLIENAAGGSLEGLLSRLLVEGDI